MEIHHFHWGFTHGVSPLGPPLQDMLDRSRRAERSQSSQAPVPVRIKSPMGLRKCHGNRHGKIATRSSLLNPWKSNNNPHLIIH